MSLGVLLEQVEQRDEEYSWSALSALIVRFVEFHRVGLVGELI